MNKSDLHRLHELALEMLAITEPHMDKDAPAKINIVPVFMDEYKRAKGRAYLGKPNGAECKWLKMVAQPCNGNELWFRLILREFWADADPWLQKQGYPVVELYKRRLKYFEAVPANPVSTPEVPPEEEDETEPFDFEALADEQQQATGT